MEPTNEPIADSNEPRLRLHHLFVLTTVMAMMLAIQGPRQNYASGQYQPSPLLINVMFVLGIANTVLSSAALTVLGYGIAGYRRGLRFFNQPGHWLLAEISLAALLAIIPTLGYRWIGFSGQPNLADPKMVLSFVLTGYMMLFMVIGRMVINFYIGKTLCAERRWSYVFYAKAAGIMLMGFGALLVIPIVLSAARIDRREGVPRDASHKVGVALQLAASTLMLVIACLTAVNMIIMFRR